MNLKNETGQEIILANGIVIQANEVVNDYNLDDIRLVQIANENYEYIENEENNIIGFVYITFDESLILSNGDLVLGMYAKLPNPINPN